jgi:TPR repeat protein
MPVLRLLLLMVLTSGLGLSGCAANRPTLIGDWPPAVSAPATGERVSSYGRGVPPKPAAAARWYRAEAERGVPEAQFNLGVFYSRGEGVARDSVEAVRWLRSAEGMGVHQAAAQLGALYAAGDVLDASPNEAERWLSAATSAGAPGAERALGDLYASLEVQPPGPRPVPTTVPMPLPAPPAILSPEDQLALGDRYRDGDGVSRDLLYAARLYTRAAEAGLPAAQLRLGSAYREGRGVPRDYMLAYKWLSLAAAAGQPEALDELELTEARLPSERVLEAQAMAREWYGRNLATQP